MNASLQMSMLGISLYCMNLDLYMLFGRVLQYFFINCYAVPRVGASLISFRAWFHNFPGYLTKLSSVNQFFPAFSHRPHLDVLRVLHCPSSSSVLVFIILIWNSWSLFAFHASWGLICAMDWLMDRRLSLSSMSCMFLLSFSLLPSSGLRTLFCAISVAFIFFVK